MKIGLLNVGNENWMGGIYYVSNLIQALQSLPANEQPDLSLVLPAEVRPYYQDVANTVELLNYPGLATTPPKGIGSRLKAFIRQSHLIVAAVRHIRQWIGHDENQVLRQLLAGQHLNLLFPCVNSLGPNFPIPWLGWAWDLQHKYYPEFFGKQECWERDYRLAKLAREARLIVISSQASRTDFDRFFPGYLDKLRVLHFRTVPPLDWYEGDVAGVKQQYELPARYLMVPNQFWTHKNHRTLFQAVNILVKQGLDIYLVCTGNTHDPRSPYYFQELCDYLKTHLLENRVRILGLIPRREQIQIMRAAAAIVQPSLFEGWSTVVEDARALGKQLFLSDIPVHREQGSTGTIYFDPHYPEALAGVISDAWPLLRPGPDLEEHAARVSHQQLVVEYARDFLEIAQELL